MSVDVMDPTDRRHPDVFTGAEALAYLHLDGKATERTLEHLRDHHDLASFRIGNATLYHKSVLDGLVLRLAGVNAVAVGRTERQIEAGSADMRIRRALGGK